MKAKCTRHVKLNGLNFNPGEEYFFEPQVFYEEYNPDMHPRPARGYQIRYIRYRVTLPMSDNLDDLYGTTEVRTAYFYDRSYCIHHDWKDERGQDIECFDDHFASCKPIRNTVMPHLKHTLGEMKINEEVMELSEDIVEYMKQYRREQMYKMFGGLSPNDWDYDAHIRMCSKTNKHE